jgi:spermidine/putrescine transport system ATP-binding protein
VDVTVRQLGAITLPASGHAGDSVAVAVRPEKIKLYQAEPDAVTDAQIRFAARVDNIAYHGSDSLVFVQTEHGARLTATVQNSSRDSALPSRGARVWLTWAAQDTLLLSD